MRSIRLIPLLLSAVLFVLAACDAVPLDSTIAVKPNEVAVVYNRETGALQDTLYEGTYTIDPIRESVVFYPLFSQVYTFDNTLPHADESLGADSIEAQTQDQATVYISAVLVFAINIDQIDLVYQHWGSIDYRAAFIRPQVRSTVRDLISTWAAQDLAPQSPNRLAALLEPRLRDALASEGFLLLRVDVLDVDIVEN